MKTEIEMKRMLFGREIKQKSKSEFFSATDLVKAGNTWRTTKGLSPFNFNKWKNGKTTDEFIRRLEEKYGKVLISARGRGQNTWVHPFLFIDLALSINPDLKIEVYSWLYDELLKYRNSSGDNYKKMCGYLFDNTSCQARFPKEIMEYASRIKEACGVKDWNTATESQLKLRDDIHKNVSLLCDVLKNNEDAVRIGIKKALEDSNEQ